MLLDKCILNQNQYDAILSFVYNVGLGNFFRSTLRQKLLRQEFEDIPNELSKWVYCKSVVLKGLVLRRKLEADLFSMFDFI